MTEKQIAIELDAATGVVIERDLTKDELSEVTAIASQQSQLLAESQAKVAARESALAKLAALGLTEEEIAAL
jgi:hypothetical protein